MWNWVVQFVSDSPYNVAGLALLIGYCTYLAVRAVLAFLSRRTDNLLDDTIVEQLKAPARYLLPIVALQFAHPKMREVLSESEFRIWSSIVSSLTIGLVAWVLMRASLVLEKMILHGQGLEQADNLTARRMYTQVRVLRKVIGFAIVVIASGLILLSFEQFSRIGTGLLASAGVMGVIIGFAAQRVLANLLAGIQIAVTQPIRHEDVVVVENEWGVIEEITLTYVVVRIWDLRRLIVPISYFLEKPFQNWTHKSAKVLGTIFFWVDYGVPLEKLRQELRRIVVASPAWDGDVHQIAVTNCDQKAMEVRALVSAATGPLCWDLRVEVREKLLAFIRKEYPGSLPVLRAEIKSAERVPRAASPRRRKST